MLESGHVRLLLAFFAAMSLHGLLFVCSLPQLKQPTFPSMQVEFLAQPHTSSTASADLSSAHRSSLKPSQEDTLKPKPVIISKRENAKAVRSQYKDAFQKAKLIPKHEPVNAELTAESRSVVLKHDEPSQVRPNMQSGKDIDMVLPVDIQKRILTRVSYPRRARRLGWEGKAEFRIHVISRGIQQVTMLLSSGHALLDRAAKKGINSIGALPLNDGLYRFPVVFRLQ